MEPIILASSSPRRQEILKRMGLPFVVNPANIDETIPCDIQPRNAPEYLACKKMEAIVKTLPLDQEIGWVLGADTLVYCGGEIFGKPRSKEDAMEMMARLQGKKHEVITGIALYNESLHDFSSRTSVNTVQFAAMSDEEIRWYTETGEWHGAAGGYRIQGMASCFIKSIDGTESSVMGLPIFELYDILKEQNYKLF